jgi:hypothetical protein
VRRPHFSSVVAREKLVGIVGQCLCPSRKTANCNKRRRRRAENGTTGGSPLRSWRYLLLGFGPSDVEKRPLIIGRPFALDYPKGHEQLPNRI